MTPDLTLIEQVARAIGNAPQDKIVGALDAYPLRMRMSFDEQMRAAEAAIATLQGSAALPSEAMIEAGAAALFSVSEFEGKYAELGDLSKQIYREKSYAVLNAAMRAATPTAPVIERKPHKLRVSFVDNKPVKAIIEGVEFSPTAPVQDDDAEWLRKQADDADKIDSMVRLSSNEVRRIASRLSSTPETGLVEALTKIDQWATAYPVKVFPEPDLDKVVALLTEAGMREQMDRMHASWARHLLEGVREIASGALSNTSPAQPDSAAVGGEATEPPLSSGPPFHAGGDHSPSPASREVSVAPAQPEDAK